MNISGPLPSSPLPRPDENTGLMLRLNQRFNAEVLQVSGQTVVLSVQGVRVVARLVSPEQSLALMNQRQAQFVVRDITSNTVFIQHLGNEDGLTEATIQQANAVIALLEGAGLPATPINQEVVRMILMRGIAVTPELLQILTQLRSQGVSGQRLERMLDLWLHGVPLSASVLPFVGDEAPPAVGLWTTLRQGLQQWLGREHLDETIRSMAQYLLNRLESIWVKDGEESGQPLAERLAGWARWFGRSLEHALSQVAQGPSIALDQALEDSLVGWLIRFQEIASESLPTELRDVLDRLITQIRYEHLLNASLHLTHDESGWLSLSLPLLFKPLGEEHPQWQMAHLRVAIQETAQGRAIDPAYTRLILEVLLTPSVGVRVDLSIVRHAMGARVEVSSSDLMAGAEAELPGLRKQLETLGYALQRAEVCLFSLPHAMDSSSSLMTFPFHSETPFEVEA
ncbi:MAG: TIGR02652 family protein [Thermanaerothrix sp.]|nr:TIGR02652 family protein [Thermanaerothrix sp.]